MRFKLPSLGSSVLLASATYVLYLGAQGQLDLYIHPRYIVFTLVMSAIGLGLTLMDGYFSTESNHTHKHKHSKLLLVPMMVLLGSALLLPARTLTSATVSQRATDAGSIVSTSGSQPVSTLFAGSSKGLKLSDWSRLLNSNKDPQFYNNKPAKISGFVYDAGLGNNTVWLARFVLTCCAVDAQPVGVPVLIENWSAEYEQDSWAEVEGQFELGQTDDGEQLLLVPSAINSIDEPDNPYAN